MSTNFPDLQPESQAIINALLDSTLNDSSQLAVSEEALARFACGWITDEESDSVIAALTDSYELRERLLELKTNVRLAEGAPSDRQRIFADDRTLGDVMSSAYKTTVQLLSSWSKSFATDFGSFTIEERRSLRAFLRNLGASVQAAQMQPGVARARGSRPAVRVVVEPGEVFADLSVHVASDESLVARAEFSHPFSEPKEISLYVVEPGGAWAWIGSNVSSGGRWELKTPQYAAMLGLPSGDITSHCFAMSEGKWLMPRGWIGLQISDELKGKGISSPARLRLRKPPVISDGYFSLGFELPASLRKLFADDNLTLAISVGSTSFVLGSWKIADLGPSASIDLRAPAGGLEDCEFESCSAIQLIVRPA